MKSFNIAIIVFSLMFSISCSNTSPKKSTEKEIVKKEYIPLEIKPAYVESITMNDSISEQLLIRGREIAGKAKLALKIELSKSVKKNGLANSISFCNQRAIEITDSIALEEQVMIKRLAKKNRNSYNEMSENESNLYKSFVIESLTSNWIQAQVGWDEMGRPVYYNPIVTEVLCLNCHGKPGTEINPEVAEKIAQVYPDDKAINFEVGQLRGMWAITFPEYMVVGAER